VVVGGELVVVVGGTEVVAAVVEGEVVDLPCVLVAVVVDAVLVVVEATVEVLEEVEDC